MGGEIESESNGKQVIPYIIAGAVTLIIIAILLFIVPSDDEPQPTAAVVTTLACKDGEELVGSKCLVKCVSPNIRNSNNLCVSPKTDEENSTHNTSGVLQGGVTTGTLNTITAMSGSSNSVDLIATVGTASIDPALGTRYSGTPNIVTTMSGPGDSVGLIPASGTLALDLALGPQYAGTSNIYKISDPTFSDRSALKMDGSHYIYVKEKDCLSKSPYLDANPPATAVQSYTKDQLKAFPMCPIMFSDRSLLKMDGSHYIYVKEKDCLSHSPGLDTNPPATATAVPSYTKDQLKAFPMCPIMFSDRSALKMDGSHYIYVKEKDCLSKSTYLDANPPATAVQSYTKDQLNAFPMCV